MSEFKIGSDADSPRRPASRLRPPPDFTRRSVKLRIFVLLASLFVVLAVAERAADPKTWRWLTEMDAKSQPQARIQNRLIQRTQRTAQDEPGTFVARADTGEDGDSEFQSLEPVEADPTKTDPADVQLDPVARAWNQGWRDLLRTLDRDQRELIFRWLLAGQKGEPAPESIREDSAELLKAIDQRWNDYHVAAFQSVQNMSDEDRILWVDVLRQVNTRWGSDVKPALEAIIAGEKPDTKQQAAIGGLEQTLRRLTLDLVEDDTTFRPAEREIWFHLLAQLHERPKDQLGNRAPEDVVYLQMYKQPDDYRGRLVRFRGVAKMGYRYDAPKNYLGIEEYNVLVIDPDGEPDSPIIVYTLDLPEGFPALKHRDKDRATTKLHEDVEITGYFFKRFAYQAPAGTYTTPQVIARSPAWVPRRTLAEVTGRDKWTPTHVAAIVAIAAVGAALTMAFIVWRIRRDTQDSITHTFNDPPQNAHFDNLDIGPSTRETLAELARRSEEQPGDQSTASQERES